MSTTFLKEPAKQIRRIAQYEGITQAQSDVLMACADHLEKVTSERDELAVALDRVKAEALREAADYLDSFEGPGGRQSAHDRAGRDIIRLISDRADRIEKGESNV